MTFERKRKYLVVKAEDIGKYLAPWDKVGLDYALECIAAGRKADGKKDNSYVVVNEDEPYAEIVWKLIELWEAKP